MSQHNQHILRNRVGIVYKNKPITIQDKKNVAQSVLSEIVYLKSQGNVDVNSVCPNNKELTVQAFFRPRKANFSPRAPFMLALKPPAAVGSSFSISEVVSYNHLRTYMNFVRLDHRVEDIDYDGVVNESVITYKANSSYTGYHLLHHKVREGWVTFDVSNNSNGIVQLANSRFLIGMANFPLGENINNVKRELASSNDSGKISLTTQAYATGFTGSIQQIGIYCRHTTQSEVLGGDFKDTSRIKVFPDLDTEPTQSQKTAVRLLSLITKKKIPIDADIVKKATEYIERKDYKKAAEIGVNLPDFYNNTVKGFALRMSNREETVDAPLNDMTATIVGVIRDQTNAKELLTGNFYYRGDPLSGVPSDTKRHMLETNTHYSEIDKLGLDLKKALIKASPQKIMGANDAVINHPDPAGVLTSRAFLSSHAVAGTNRRQVEFALKQFMCVNMTDIADTNASDLRVGRDIDRFPGGSHKKYQTSCKGCHSVMDGFRGAFAKTDYKDDSRFVMYSDYFSMNTKYLQGKLRRYPANISYKVNHNEFAYSKGYLTTDDSFYNFANRGANKILFGWRGTGNKGYGMGQFGKMLSESERFSKCMVKRVFEAVCPVNISEDILKKLNPYVKDFEKNNYDLKSYS